MSKPCRLHLSALLALLFLPPCSPRPVRSDCGCRHAFEAEADRLDQLVLRVTEPAGAHRRTS